MAFLAFASACLLGGAQSLAQTAGAYITNAGSNNVSVIDTKTNKDKLALFLREGPMRVIVLLFAILAATAAPGFAQPTPHRLLIHVDSPQAEVMREALHNAANVIDMMRKEGNKVAIEIVANGPGTAMFISELSPVKGEVRHVHALYPDVVMSACGISLAHTEADMKKKLTVLREARVVSSGALRIIALRIMELEEQHWAYLKP